METITASCLPAEILSAHPKDDRPVALTAGFKLEEHLDQLSRRYLQEAGQAAGGNMRRMADLLGLSYRSLRYLMDKYQIKSFKKADAKDERNGNGAISQR